MTARKIAAGSTAFFLIALDTNSYGDESQTVVGPKPTLEAAQKAMSDKLLEEYEVESEDLENNFTFLAFEVVSAAEFSAKSSGVKFTQDKKLF